MIPTLTMLQNIEETWSRPERVIDRKILLEVSPDREALLKSNKSIDEIRQDIKLPVANPPPEHWLFRVQRHENARLKDATVPLSVLDPVVSYSADPEADSSPQATIYVVEPVPNAPSTSASSSTDPSSETSYGISTEPILLGNSKPLISPRQLGPTHMLVIYTLPPIVLAPENSNSSRTRRSPRPESSGRIAQRRPSIFSEALELPISDLIFIANVPNLTFDPEKGILPHRLPNELPRVVLPVPHLLAFPELVVYLHTRNQAALFRALIPDWARDVMHPLPMRPTPTPGVSRHDHGEITPSPLCCAPFRARKLSRVFTRLSRSRSSPNLEVAIPLNNVGLVRTIAGVGDDLADAAENSQHGVGSPEEALCKIAASLDALRDNLEYIGYFEHQVWAELLTYRRVLLSALLQRSRVPT
ncbi:hypothetical protein BDN70DRAFT_997351 [Pholiota conissans]|uniref:Uncharacterized protein n=1 Tax=Pholiota conissans TaxID=109636 RepID=A0A9P5YQG3_9AGAR|nr:hypothetical protein BDN70DRAFT_997351 [Pholiota conissans]